MSTFNTNSLPDYCFCGITHQCPENIAERKVVQHCRRFKNFPNGIIVTEDHFCNAVRVMDNIGLINGKWVDLGQLFPNRTRGSSISAEELDSIVCHMRYQEEIARLARKSPELFSDDESIDRLLVRHRNLPWVFGEEDENMRQNIMNENFKTF
jgi:hypothetical protein